MTNEQKRKQLTRLFGAYDKRLEALYDTYINKLTTLADKVGIDVEGFLQKDGLFRFEKFPELQTELNDIFSDYVQKDMLCYRAGITDGVALAYAQDKALLTGVSVLGNKAISHARSTAAEAFIRNRMLRKGGLSLSQLVWNYAQQSKSEFEVAVSNVIADGLKAGTSAEELGRLVRQYLNNPDMMYRRYHRTIIDANGNKRDVVKWRRRIVDENGKTRFVEQPLEDVGMGHYRSSRKNASRLMRTEINMAYHKANSERWQQEPFVIGISIELSPQHPEYDMCDELAGRYPKDFVFISWHPQCYSNDTKVLTQQGWKLFADVSKTDKILSLNPSTRQIEYANIVDKQCWKKKGSMVHFYNRNLDSLVTPEHRMVYLNKSDGRIKYCTASEYSAGKGGFYRGCIYSAEDRKDIKIGNTIINFDLFCEFMGYYLSDGSLIRTHQVVISQRDGQPHKKEIKICIEKMGFKTTTSFDFIIFYSGDLCSYLRQFGVCNQKYIPNEIMSASKRQIGIFLDAFVKCDGHIKRPRSFIGNRGNVFIPKRVERCFYTTSAQMAGNLSELLLKIGHRPSINEIKPSTTIKKDGSVIKGKLLCYKINDCNSNTATVFNRRLEDYDGYVYDLTLEQNHIMYVSRNGRCYWGSNCLCTANAITIQGEEREEFYRRMMAGEDMSNYVSPYAVKDIPDKAKAWIEANHDKFVSAGERGKLGYIWKENEKYLRPYFSRDEQQKMGFNVVRTKGAKTAEEKAAIIQRWNEHQLTRAKIEIKNAHLLDSNTPVLNTRLDALRAAIDTGDYTQMSKALQEVRHGIKIQQDADFRHLHRDSEAIQKAWDERRAKNALIIKTGKNVWSVADNLGYVEINGMKGVLRNAIITDNVMEVQKLSKALAKEIAYINQQAKAYSEYIPNAKQWLQEMSLEDLKPVYAGIESTTQKIVSKSYGDLALQEKYLKWEAEDHWGKGLAQKYPKTWKVSQDSYYALAEKAAQKSEWSDIKVDLEILKDFKTKSPIIKDYIAKLEAATQTEKDLPLAKKLLAEAEKKKAALEKSAAYREAKKAGKNAADLVGGTSITPLSEEEALKLIKQFTSDYTDAQDLFLRKQTKKLWKSLTPMERRVLTKYTQTYSYLNEPLREIRYSAERTWAEFEKDMPLLTDALNKMKATKDMVVRRGTYDFHIKSLGKNLSDLKAGDEWVDGGFLSTSVRTDKGFFKSHNLVIVAPKNSAGVYAEPFSHYTDNNKFDFYDSKLWNGVSKEHKGIEWEWIGQRGSKFKVLKVEGNTIYMQIVGQLFDQTTEYKQFFR